MPERVRHVPPQVWWILLIGAALRLGFFVVAENNGGDALARAAMTAGWLQHPAFRLNFEPWLPVHFWLMGGMSLLVRDVSFGSRALSLVLGVSTLAVFWLLVKEIYGKRAALLSLLVFTFYALHIGYSTTSSSEAPYLFFLLCGLLAFFWYRQLHSLAFLIVAAIALAIGAGIRYEAWICIFAVFLVLLLMPSENANLGHGKHVREVLSFGAIAALWPLFWMAYQWKMFAKPLYGVTMNYAWVAQQTAIEHRSALYRLVQPAGVILLTLCPIAVIASIYGLVSGMRLRRSREFGLILLTMGTVFAIQSTTGGVNSMARYTITLGTLIAIPSGYGFCQFARFMRRSMQTQFRAAITVLLLLNLGAILAVSELPNRLSDKFSAISPRLRFPNRIEELRQYLRPRITVDDALVIDDYNVESNIIAAAVGVPFRASSRVFLASSHPISELTGFFHERHPRYVIYSDRGVLPAALPLQGKCTSSGIRIQDRTFQCLFENDVYRVYQVTYGQSFEADERFSDQAGQQPGADQARRAGYLDNAPRL